MESTVDIKDFILVGGGLLIAAVVVHGFWIAWRERRQDLRIDIKPDLIPEEVDEIERLRGELPNGGGRVVRQPDPQQDSLDLEPPPLSLEPVDAPPLSDMRPAEPAAYEAPEQATPEEVDAVLFGSDWRQAEDSLLDDLQAADAQPADTAPETTQRTEPVLGGEPSRAAAEAGADAAPIVTDSRKAPDAGATRTPEAERAKVADVAMPDPIVADEPKRPRRLGSRKTADWGSSRRASTSTSREESRDTSSAAVPVEELIVMNVLAEPDRPFTGDELFATLRTCGLKFGDMNIFHRVEPLTKAVQYSVASAVEPGTFDMAEMEAIRCPGLCLFMQLPGPEDPTAVPHHGPEGCRRHRRKLGGRILTAQPASLRRRLVD